MTTKSEKMEIERTAAIHDGLGHPVRMAMLHALREQNELTSAELGRAVTDSYTTVDARRVQFHVYKMQAAGIVDVQRVGRGDVIRLRRDVSLKTRDL